MNNNNAIHDSKSTNDEVEPAVAARAASRGRRRLLGGLVGAPIVALAARPALAQQCTISGAHSAFFASHRPNATCSVGRSPGYWMENYDAWDATPYSPGVPSSRKSKGLATFTGGTTFEMAFRTAPRSCSPYFKGELISMMNVMRCNPGSPEFHWVAALLNSITIPGYPYSSGDVINMWNNPEIVGPGITYADIADFFHLYLES